MNRKKERGFEVLDCGPVDGLGDAWCACELHSF